MNFPKSLKVRLFCLAGVVVCSEYKTNKTLSKNLICQDILLLR